jgi:hypothetical protein
MDWERAGNRLFRKKKMRPQMIHPPMTMFRCGLGSFAKFQIGFFLQIFCFAIPEIGEKWDP